MRATSYSRVSADDLRERRSVGEQETANRETIEREGWTLAGSFLDNDRSASRHATKDRPGFADLVRHIEGGGCDVLVLWESSRGSRTLTEWSKLLDLCRERRVLIHVVSDRRTYDVYSIARDWKTLAEDGVSNAYASDETQKRVLRTLAANAANGRPHGRIIYGYSREYDARGRFVCQTIREDQATVIQEIARRIIERKSTSSIVAWLNGQEKPEDGRKPSPAVPTPALESTLRRVEELRASDVEDDHRLADELEQRAAAFKWDLTGLKKLMVNPAYAGLRVHLGQVVGDAGWPKILTVDEHRKVRDILTDDARKTARDGAVRHLLTNVAHCGECGGALIAQKVRGGRYAYLCGARFCVSVSSLWLEPFVEDIIIRRLDRKDAVARLAPKVDQADVERAAAEVIALQKELDDAIDTVGRPGGLTVTTLARLEQSLTPRIEDAKRRANPATVPAILVELAGPGAAARWKRLDIAQRRTVVRLLVDVRVRRGHRGARTFDPARVGNSRWLGDSKTWAQLKLV